MTLNQDTQKRKQHITTQITTTILTFHLERKKSKSYTMFTLSLLYKIKQVQLNIFTIPGLTGAPCVRTCSCRKECACWWPSSLWNTTPEHQSTHPTWQQGGPSSGHVPTTFWLLVGPLCPRWSVLVSLCSATCLLEATLIGFDVFVCFLNIWKQVGNHYETEVPDCSSCRM